MYDTIERIGQSVIQHGKMNDRIYLMRYAETDIPAVCRRFDELVGLFGYSKLFIKIADTLEKTFTERGFCREAVIPGFFQNGHDCLFMGAYPEPSVRDYIDPDEQKKTDEVLSLALSAHPVRVSALSPPFTLRNLSENNIGQLCSLYRAVFPSYPFPVGDPDYIRHTMKDNVIYLCIFSGPRLVAASSAEMNFLTHSAEMTDFAVLPGFRGHGFAAVLLDAMEREMERRSVSRLFTIARSLSSGMNITFSRAGYTFAGMLRHNTNISGHIESMNVWYRFLPVHE